MDFQSADIILQKEIHSLYLDKKHLQLRICGYFLFVLLDNNYKSKMYANT